MLFGMTWWATLFVLVGLFALTLELGAITGDEDEDEETKTSDFILYCGRLLYYVAASALAILYFRDLESEFWRGAFAVAALYSIPFGLYLIIGGVIEFIKDPAGGSEDGEEIGIVSHALGYLMVVAFSGGGLAFAIVGGQPIWSAYI